MDLSERRNRIYFATDFGAVGEKRGLSVGRDGMEGKSQGIDD